LILEDTVLIKWSIYFAIVFMDLFPLLIPLFLLMLRCNKRVRTNQGQQRGGEEQGGNGVAFQRKRRAMTRDKRRRSVDLVETFTEKVY
jgi:hypothetical protein